MRVLHVMNSASGGAALSTLGLMRQLKAYGVEASAVCIPSGTKSEQDTLKEATDGRTEFTHLYWWNKKTRAKAWKRPLIEARQLWRTGAALGSIRRVTDVARSHHAELIHSNTILTIEGGYAASRLGIPHVWHLRELVGPGQTFQFAMSPMRFGHFVEQRCDALIANSHVSASLVAPFISPQLLRVIPNGIDLAPFAAIHREVDSARTIVAMVASLNSRSKNHERFIRAAMLVDRALPVEFRIYGHDLSQGGTVRGDAYVDRLYDIVNASPLKDRFRWMGFVDRPECIMAEVDILVHPTELESFGRIAVEAMAAGLPVVGVSGGGIGEIVQDGVTGLLAEPTDVAGIATRIEQLARNPALRTMMGAEGRRVATEKYSLDACAQAVFRVYQHVCSRQNQPPQAIQPLPASANA